MAPAAWQLMDNAARYTNEEHSALLHREAFDSIHGTPKGGIHRIGWFLRTILPCLASGAAGAECGASHGKAISFDHFVGYGSRLFSFGTHGFYFTELTGLDVQASCSTPIFAIPLLFA